MKILTPEECAIYVMMVDKGAFNGLVRAGAKRSYFPKRGEMFDLIVKKRLESDEFELSSHEIGRNQNERLQLLEISTAANEQMILPSSWKSYYDNLRAAHNERVLRKELKGLNNFTKEHLLEVFSRVIEGIDGDRAHMAGTDEIIESLLKMYSERQSKDYENPYRIGLSKYDQLGHFMPGSLIVLGGSSGHGKSTLAINFAYHWARCGMKVLYFSYEMTPEVVVAKMNCINTRLSWDKAMNIKGERFNPEEDAKFRLGIGDIRGMKVIINDRIQSLPEITGIVNAYAPDVFIVDTINHLIDQAAAENEKFWIYLGKVAREFKEIAKKRGIICVAIAQLREYIGRPASKYFIGESKEIANTADYMDFIFRAKEGNMLDCPPALEDIIEIYRVKGRLTGIGSAFLHVDDKTSYVRNLSYGEEDAVLEALKRHLKVVKKGAKY